MSKKVYSGIGEIPRGLAGDGIVEGCLVLEGGAFRGLYTQGFLDELMLNDINIGCVIGVSAGALAGMNYVSGQIGRSARINLEYRHDSRYVGVRALIHSKSFLDVGFLTEERGIIEPLDRGRFLNSKIHFVAVATNCQTGEPTYFEKGKCSDIMRAVRASATMPYISPMVKIDDVPYFDGGCSCNIPYEWPIEKGYKKIMVIKTRDKLYGKSEKSTVSSAMSNVTASRLYRKYPELTGKLNSSAENYNRQCDEIDRLHDEGRILRIAPSQPIEVSRVEKDMEKLGELYHLGREDCANKLETIRDYFGMPKRMRNQKPYLYLEREQKSEDQAS